MVRQWGFMWISFLFVGSIIFLGSCSKESSVTVPQNVNRPGVTWYISPTGSDTESGTNRDHAFKTLKHALSKAQPGDTIIILSGIYTETVDVEHIGSSGSILTIQGENRDNSPIFDGQNQKKIMFRCFKCQNIVIENIEIRNYRASGISFWQSSYVTIRNVHFINVARELDDWVTTGSSAIIISDDTRHALVEENVIENSGYRDPQKDEIAELINCWRCKDSTIRNNVIRNYEGDGILIEEACRATVENNRVENGLNHMQDWWGSGLWVDGGQGSIIRNNIFQDNEGPGIQISDTELEYRVGGSRGYRVEGNRVTRSRWGIYIWNFGRCPPPDDVVHMGNNAFEQNSGQDVYCIEWVCGENEPCVGTGAREPVNCSAP